MRNKIPGTARRWNSVQVMLFRTAAAVAAVLPLTALAAPIRDFIVDYHYVASENPDLQNSVERLQIGEIVDLRGLPPRIVFPAPGVNYRLLATADRAEVPFAEIVRSALVQGLKASHAPLVGDNGSLVLTGEIVAFAHQGIPSGFIGADYESKLYVMLRLIAAGTGQPVWHEAFQIPASSNWHSVSAVNDLVRQTLDTLVSRLLANDDFQHALLAVRKQPPVKE
jgi:hypothetical protein